MTHGRSIFYYDRKVFDESTQLFLSDKSFQPTFQPYTIELPFIKYTVRVSLFDRCLQLSS